VNFSTPIIPAHTVAHAVPRSEFRTFDSPEPRQGRRVERSADDTKPTGTTGEPVFLSRDLLWPPPICSAKASATDPTGCQAKHLYETAAMRPRSDR